MRRKEWLRPSEDMRITYIHQYFNTPAMSGSTRSYEMARRLVQMGHEVNLITTKRDGDANYVWEVTEESGVKVHWISIPYSNKMRYRQRLHAFFLFVICAARRAASIPSDLIFATSTPLTIALPAIYAKWKRSIPMVLEVRDLWPEVPIALGALNNPILRFAAKLLERFAYVNSSSIIALSPDMRDGIVRTGYPCGQVSVIPNGSDLDLFETNSDEASNFRKAHGIPLDRIMMVYAGTLGRVNGVGYLVDLAKEMIDDTRFFILIIGDGAEYNAIESRAKASGCLGLNLSIIKPVPKRDMQKVLASTDVAISTVIPVKALEANSANKIFDGMAAGCCIAINHGGWLANLLKDTGAGVVLSHNVEDSVLQIKSLLDAPDQLSQMKINARKLAKSTFSRDLLADQLVSVLKSVVGEDEGRKSVA